MRGGMYAWMGRWGKRVTEYKPGGGGAGGDVSIAVLIGTSCCEMLTCCLNSPGVPAHAPCSVCCFVCVCVCVWMYVRAWLYSGTLWQIILCIYPHMHFPHWLTHEPSYRQYICALVWQASQTLPLSLTHECTHMVTALYVHSPPTMPSVWATLMWHFWQLGRLEMTALVHTQDIYTNTCRIPPPLCFTTYTKRLRVTDRSATLAVRGKKALRGSQGSRQVVFVPIEHTTLCATRPFYFSIRQSYRIQTFKKDLGR